MKHTLKHTLKLQSYLECSVPYKDKFGYIRHDRSGLEINP